MRSEKTVTRRESGIALITTLLLLLLMAAMVVGFMLLVSEGQRLSGMDSDQLRAFYGAESGMEKLTADLGQLFATTYSPSGAQVDALTTTPPTLPSSTGVSYVDALGNPTYSISYTKDNNGNPQASFAQISSGSSPFQGMSALETTYTLTVGALTNTGGQVKLQRTTQTVGIPLFQFGIFSQTDLDYFPGPNFNFGGRVHSNGNIFFASGGPANATPTMTTTNQLWLASPVTAVGDVIRDCLENTHAISANGTHPGSVEITKGGGVYQALGFGQGSLNNCLGSGKNSNWPAISASFNGNLRSGVKPLNMTITLLGSANPIDIIRRPLRNEDTSNPGVLGERYFAEASLKILISDNAADITNLPCTSAGAPFNLADLAKPAGTWASANAVALQTAMNALGTPVLPLATSGGSGAAALTGSYNPTDGYWQANGTPLITGYFKIDAQTAYGQPCGTWKDVTQEILSLGYAGRNINPVPQSFDGVVPSLMWGGTTYNAGSGKYTNTNMAAGAAPNIPSLPLSPATNAQVQMASQDGPALAAGPFTAAMFNTGTCLDPHPNAVIRLERIRDNPSTVAVQPGAYQANNPGQNLPLQSTVTQVCGVDPTTKAVVASNPTDFWPNVLFDTREGTLRDVVPPGAYAQRVRLGGVMHYIELDMNNLAKWFSGTIGTSGPSTRDPNVAPNNFVVYVSDRRSNYATAGSIGGSWPPLSPSGNETGEYGFSDFANPGDVNGCPNGTLDPGEDVDQIGSAAGFFGYGQLTFPTGLVDSTGQIVANTLFQGAISSLIATTPDPNCATGPFPWPGTYLVNSNEGRQNPSPLFRRAVKLVHGSVLNLPACPGGVSCGLTVAMENPAYVQGDFNANSAGNGFADASVAASVAADAVTFLSGDWNDVNSFNYPYNTGGRTGNTTYYRLGILAGKSQYFPIPNWDTTALNGSQDFGTDGGVHNFIRYIERWNGTLFYQGSVVSMFYNRQAVGLFKCCNTIYNPPARGYSFDVNFLNPTLLPPRTPMFRDVNTTGFTQLMLPNQ